MAAGPAAATLRLIDGLGRAASPRSCNSASQGSCPGQI
jgi:hypothetical protein